MWIGWIGLWLIIVRNCKRVWRIKGTKAAEVAQLKNEYRLLTDFQLSPNATLLCGMVANCTDEQCSALLEQLRARQNQLDLEREGRERDAALNCDSDPDLVASGV